ncbi:MAG: HTTM domain-containing protein [Nitrospinales bacterium]
MSTSYKALSTLSNFLMRPVDSSSLGAFRFLFGILLAWKTLRLIMSGSINSIYIDRKYLFAYEFFPWLEPLPGDGMHYLFAIMGISALMLAIGFLYRLSAAFFLCSYTYIFLLEKSVYNNHDYFICLLAFLFFITNGQRWIALDLLLKRKSAPETTINTIPYWNLFLFKSQIFFVYFYGGVAKINFDWLKGEPMRHWLGNIATKENTPGIVGKFMESEVGVYFFSYGGLIFDLCIGFLLIYKKTRLLGFGLILIFNLTNIWMFNIGLFPYLMIAATIIFIEPNTPRIIVQKFFPDAPRNDKNPIHKYAKQSAPIVLFVVIYLAIQIVLPFRHWFYKGNVSWTEEGHNFAWHMKLRDKSNCRLSFLATNPGTGKTWPISAERYLVLRQYKEMCKRPHMILQFAHFLGKELESDGIKNPIIRARTLVSLNFHPPVALIDPTVDLTQAENSLFESAKWILPIKN